MWERLLEMLGGISAFKGDKVNNLWIKGTESLSKSFKNKQNLISLLSFVLVSSVYLLFLTLL